jgi:hypothetical protein
VRAVHRDVHAVARRHRERLAKGGCAGGGEGRCRITDLR